MATTYTVYMLKCADSSLYTGITTDLKRRLEEHNSSKIGAKYTKARRPVELVYSEVSPDKSTALKREYELKQLSRKEKLDLFLNKLKVVIVNDRMQKGYSYVLSEPEGKNFDSEFNPPLSPKEMLALGIFGGKYMNDCRDEFPKSWFIHAKLSPNKKDPSINLFGVDASQSLSEWKKKGWIFKDDPRGWFQWYCRYFRGRRLPEEDKRQIKRWKAMKRHAAQIVNKCRPGDLACNKKQRQALLHWAYDSRKL